MNDYFIAIATAAWLGFLCSISPCPLATNIAAISFVSRKVGKVSMVLSTGLLYTLGRTVTYTVLGVLLVGGLTSAPELSHALQKYMNLMMGPLLILVAMVLLNLLNLKTPSASGISQAMQKRVESMGIFGGFFLGVFFAMSFCPTSAALFFGSLLPLAVNMESGLVVPGTFGIATGMPVLFFAFLLAFGANKVAKAYNKLAKFEVWAQRITGAVFLIIGIGMTFTITLGIKLW
ncbi:MAG: aromatic aminobenezylarsenical efflux permease ArsG family transporter [Victivallaceae bacterium]|nr:aromatic aminobenezylarsenical efflux permease ArsG family transporter [Victivallaceae bacterium]MDD3116901.1 aromatic aminobenezylarsenical efflux permease ArsG family transporter [Victivallaceae bacterium]MDD3703108.1 aromatic aminobenezylarsenical efflux permease ArsG family transporter [Victivallaceae bacterium]MDD4316979.1 aromatic aminobenezylarsenical efflux permease ArsG family transporter [Victivallaceae bacterium]MDD5664237.1 aromatic aminobenezylarsenical efflux permease ArsG fami